MDPGIKDVQIVLDFHKQKLLVYIDLTFWSGLFREKTIINNIYIRLSEMLTDYNLRVITDEKLFKKVLTLLK